jgi:hypothetical protein
MSKLIQYYNKIEELTFFVSNILTRKSSDQKADNQPNAFLFILALKTTNGLRSVNYLIVQAPEHIHLFDSVFILLRTLLSDAITHFYLLAKTIGAPDPDAIFIEQIEILEGDHIKYLDKNLAVYKKLYNDDDIKIGRMQSEIRQQYPKYFKKENQTYKHKSINVGGMVMEVVESKAPFLISAVTPAYEFYDTFSKLEHLGVLTLQLVTRHYYIEKHKDIFREIYWSIYSILLSLNSLIIPFVTPDEREHFEKSINEILDIKIYE